MGNIAVLLLRGTINVPEPVKDTLHMMRLRNQHVCVILPDSPTTKGMIRKVKDLVTWGEVDEETIKMLQEKRGERDTTGKLKPWYRLGPPRKGFERKGLKVPYKLGGALGDRGKDIRILLERMI